MHTILSAMMSLSEPAVPAPSVETVVAMHMPTRAAVEDCAYRMAVKHRLSFIPNPRHVR